jgi:hypothetical protein
MSEPFEAPLDTRGKQDELKLRPLKQRSFLQGLKPIFALRLNVAAEAPTS